MLKPKQKAYLKGLANRLKPVYQVGKDGVNDELLKGVYNHLVAHELMKVSVLNNSMLTPQEVASEFEENGFEVVQIIGHIIVLYMKSDKNKSPIILPL